MTRVKTYPRESENSYYHRTHRSKKNRNYIEPKDLNARQQRRIRLEELRLEEMELDDYEQT